MSTAVSAGAYLHHMTLESSDPVRLADFYADAMDMTKRRLDGGDWICEGPLRRMLFTLQEEFAARYHIPLGTLRDWDQGRATPDQPTQAYLTVIARSPEEVQQALEG